MTKMTVQEMHKRLMLYKMVREVVAKQNTGGVVKPWLCNLNEYRESTSDTVN